MIQCMKHNQKNDLVMTGHSDNNIRIWDFRVSASSEAVVKQTFKSHKGWVMAVDWKPESEFMFCSGAADGTLKLWDLRSSIPVQTVENIHDKQQILALSWLPPVVNHNCSHLITSGADSRLLVNNIPN